MSVVSPVNVTYKAASVGVHGTTSGAEGVRDALRAFGEKVDGLDKVVGKSYNLFGQEGFSIPSSSNAIMSEVEGGYKVVYNTSLTSGACIGRIKWIEDVTPIAGRKITLSFDQIVGENNTTGSSQRVAIYSGKTFGVVSSNTNGHKHTTVTAPSDITGAGYLYIYPDSKNVDRTVPCELTVTNIQITVTDSEISYMPPKTAVDYVARYNAESQKIVKCTLEEWNLLDVKESVYYAVVGYGLFYGTERIV